jgi:hypothetical protein
MRFRSRLGGTLVDKTRQRLSSTIANRRRTHERYCQHRSCKTSLVQELVCPRMDVLSSGAEGSNERFRSIALLLCLLSSFNAFAIPRHRHRHRSSFRSYSTRSTHHDRLTGAARLLRTTSSVSIRVRLTTDPAAAVPDTSSITPIRWNAVGTGSRRYTFSGCYSEDPYADVRAHRAMLRDLFSTRRRTLIWSISSAYAETILSGSCVFHPS